MRMTRLALAATAALALATPAAGQRSGGIVLVTDKQAFDGDFRACMVTARGVLLGAGMVIQPLSASVVASNEDRTISIRCDLPGYAVFDEALFPSEEAWINVIAESFEKRQSSPLIPAAAKAHEYRVDCFERKSCEIDPAAICRQAYEVSAEPSAEVLSRTECADAQGSYTCGVVYDLNCN